MHRDRNAGWRHWSGRAAARPTSFLSCHRTSMWAPPVGGTFWFQIFITGQPCCRTAALPARQLGYLNEVAAGVVQLGDCRASYLGRRHGELGAARFDALVVALDVVGIEQDRGLALLDYGLLVGLGRRIVVERELQLQALNRARERGICSGSDEFATR